MKRLLTHIIFLGLLYYGLTLSAIATEISINPNLFYSERHFEYSVFNGGVKGITHSLGGNATLVYQPFYFDLGGEKNITASEEPTNNLLSTDRITFDRTDFTATIGYASNQSISIFAGYKYGKSNLTALAPSPFVGAKISLAGKGAFIGAGGHWKIADKGLLAFSAAFAKMATFYKDLAIGTAEGDASGTSLMVQWKGSLTQHWGYDLSLIRHDYYYENFNKFSWDISEQILSYRLGLSYRF